MTTLGAEFFGIGGGSCGSEHRDPVVVFPLRRLQLRVQALDYFSVHTQRLDKVMK